ncbi:MAG: hypothetical protein D6706_12475 [Chloroflexi bacterium]|nr:MAG: hypothetical protein D6706_12475 [Chloroflexota bacterium]
MNAFERAVLRPYQHRVCLFVEFSSLPKGYGRYRLWFPRILFGTARPGLLLIVDDWMQLSRDIEVARTQWREERLNKQRHDSRSPAAHFIGKS